MNSGPVVTAVVAIVAMSAALMTFMKNASPYVTISQARRLSDDHLHLAGDIIKNSVSEDIVHHTLNFRLKDSDGNIVRVVHKGDPPANIGEANKVVAIGGMKGNDFVSEKLLVKCPSKYEGQTKSATVAQN